MTDVYSRSCRSCGNALSPTSICVVCREDISWLCGSCGRAEDATHLHP